MSFTDGECLKAIYRYSDPFFMFCETCDVLRAGTGASIGMGDFTANHMQLVCGQGDGPHQPNYTAGDLWMRVVVTTRHLLAHLPFFPEDGRQKVALWVLHNMGSVMKGFGYLPGKKTKLVDELHKLSQNDTLGTKVFYFLGPVNFLSEAGVNPLKGTYEQYRNSLTSIVPSKPSFDAILFAAAIGTDDNRKLVPACVEQCIKIPASPSAVQIVREFAKNAEVLKQELQPSPQVVASMKTGKTAKSAAKGKGHLSKANKELDGGSSVALAACTYSTLIQAIDEAVAAGGQILPPESPAPIRIVFPHDNFGWSAKNMSRKRKDKPGGKKNDRSVKYEHVKTRLIAMFGKLFHYTVGTRESDWKTSTYKAFANIDTSTFGFAITRWNPK